MWNQVLTLSIGKTGRAVPKMGQPVEKSGPRVRTGSDSGVGDQDFCHEMKRILVAKGLGSSARGVFQQARALSEPRRASRTLRSLGEHRKSKRPATRVLGG